MTDERKQQLKKHEQWLFTLKILTVLCLIGTIVFTYLFIKQKIDFAPAILFALSTIMFFMANKEKSKEAKPGSPEYEAIEHAKAAKQAQNRERVYRRQHPFMVARELVEDNKAAVKKADKKEAALKKAKADNGTAAETTETAKAEIKEEPATETVAKTPEKKFPAKAKAKASAKQAPVSVEDDDDMDTSIFEDV